MDRNEILLLSYIGFGFKRFSYIKENFGSIFNIPESSFDEVCKILRTKKEVLLDVKKKGIDEVLRGFKKELDRHEVCYVTLLDSEYPLRLKELPDRPIVLYYKGNIKILNSRVTCGIVGTRRNDEVGKVHTRNLVDLLVRNNVVVVSGLARGIDIIAHRRALEAGGQTVAILAGGLDYIYPPEHRKDFFSIIERGCAVSEFPLGVRPLKRNFFIRNRIISGLSDVVVIVQAPEKSGALITGEYALRQKKTLFVVPGGMENYLHRGCNAMLKKGAIPILDYKDVLEELGYKSLHDPSLQPQSSCKLSEEESFIYSLITKEITLDELAEISGLAVNKIYPILLSLEIKGMVIQNTGGTFSRVMV